MRASACFCLFSIISGLLLAQVNMTMWTSSPGAAAATLRSAGTFLQDNLINILSCQVPYRTGRGRMEIGLQQSGCVYEKVGPSSHHYLLFIYDDDYDMIIMMNVIIAIMMNENRNLLRRFGHTDSKTAKKYIRKTVL